MKTFCKPSTWLPADYIKFYRGKLPESQQDTKSDQDVLREHYRQVLASTPATAALGAHTVPWFKHSTAFKSGLACTHQPSLLCCRFIRDEADDKEDTWEVRLAKRYYSKLFKEYCIADLSRYKVTASTLCLCSQA